MFYSFQYFPAFSALFPRIHLYRVAYKWRMDKIIYQQVNDSRNIKLILISIDSTLTLIVLKADNFCNLYK